MADVWEIDFEGKLRIWCGFSMTVGTISLPLAVVVCRTQTVIQTLESVIMRLNCPYSGKDVYKISYL